MKKLLILFLAVLPFQWHLSSILSSVGLNPIAIVVKSLDELFIIGAILIIVVIRLMEFPRFTGEEILLLVPIMLIGFWDVISGLVNANKGLITALGTFFHIKNFFVIFLFSSINWESREIQKCYDIFKKVAILLATVAILQEITALTGKYLLDTSLIFWPSAAGYYMEGWRAGLYRSPSLVGHPNILGIYLLLILVIELRMAKRNNFILLLLSFGIMTTLSRMIYFIFVVVSLPFIRHHKLFIIFFVLTLVFVGASSQNSLSELGVVSYEDASGQQLMQTGNFRAYTLNKSLEIWKDRPLFGVGPGMYGDVISFLFNSPIYEKYGFDPPYFQFANKNRGLDQFYPVILAESGTPSLVFFLMSFISLLVVPLILSRKISDTFETHLAKGLTIVPVVFVLLITIKSINMTFFFFPYFALLGMLLSFSRSRRKNSKAY